MKDISILKIGRFRLSFAWYDFWVGAFIDKTKHKIYLCPFPTVLITINLSPK